MFARFKSLFGAQDMTVGNPTSVILKFAIPLLIGNLAQQLYSTVDAIIVGQYVGDGALAAVGAAFPIFNLLLVFFMGISIGAGIIVSQFFGAKNREMLSKTICNIITLTLLMTAFIMVVGTLISFPALELAGTPTDIIHDASAYLTTICLGFLGCAFYNMISGMLRGMGDSIMPLIFLLITCFLNIVLDLLFVAVFGMGVFGVALATVIAQSFSAVLCLIRLLKMKDVIDMKLSYLKLDSHIVARTVKLGLPAGLAQAIFACAGIVVQSLTNSFGTSFIAVTTVVMRVDGFAVLPCMSFGMAMTTYVGQNIGAEKTDRVNGASKHGLKISLIVSVCIVVLIVFFGRYLIQIFTSTPEVLDMGERMLRLLSVGYIALTLMNVFMGIMRGAGDTMTPMIISAIGTVGIRVPVAYGIAYFTRSDALPNGNPEAIFYSLLISWVLGAALTYIFYRRGKWKTKYKKVES